MASLQKRFGRTVARLRKEAGYSQEEFARAAKLNRGYMSEIERGTTNVSLDVVERIMKALKMSIAELFQAVNEE